MRSSRGAKMKLLALSGCALVALATAAEARGQSRFEVAGGDLKTALQQFAGQTNQEILFSSEVVAGLRTGGVSAELDAPTALAELLRGTGLTYRKTSSGTLLVVQEGGSGPQSAGAGGDVEALIVTAQKREENIQDVPIAMSAFSQEDLTTRQVAGGPDLMTQVPNFTFTKTNFTGYSIQIRGIGTQAISATVDPAVAVAFNNTPFIRNRFFEQEFFDVNRVEVLRGPQGTLYGRNATAGVVNLLSARPTYSFDSKLSVDIGNYDSRRLEGMVNIPLAQDKVALRLAGAWTKREGYSTNQLTGAPIDGRDLWSGRATLGFEPTDRLSAFLVYEHFEEDDDRLRSGKQLCKKDMGPSELGGVTVPQNSGGTFGATSYLSQGCSPVSLYADEAFQTPNGFALPFYGPLSNLGAPVRPDMDPYVSQVQSTDLRVIESMLDPAYRAKTDLGQLQINFDLTDNLTLSSETAYSTDFLFSTQDYNRFNTKPGAFDYFAFGGRRPGGLNEEGVFCDPQLGCSDRLILGDLSTAKSRQFSQEFRLSSDYDGPFNFSFGTNFLRYDTEDKYYVFINILTLFASEQWGSHNGRPYIPSQSDNSDCLPRGLREGDPRELHDITACIYIDPNPIGSLNDQGHNYFLSKNPYNLISYAAFGEAYYNITPDLKLTAGLRWTVDKKSAPQVPSWLLAANNVGYPVAEVVDQEWTEPTGRVTLDWHPQLSFTDETMVYASYAHGYKAGGANPPPPVVATYSGFDRYTDVVVAKSLIHPKTFDAEFVDAFEIGTKNTLLDGRLTFNLNAFYYDYEGYQISQLVNRSAVNLNFDAEVWGAELEMDWRPLDNLRLGFKGGWQETRMANGSEAIDLMDRTAGREGWVVVKPFPTVPSNCILPISVVTYGGQLNVPSGPGVIGPCVLAYLAGMDPLTGMQYVEDPDEFWGGELPEVWAGYPGFDPRTAPNNGEGFTKDLGGNELPNAPNFTATVTADYTVPLPGDWLMTLHSDFYYQSEAWTRVFNTEGYDKLKAYTNVNFAAIFNNEASGLQVMAYVKNVFDRDSITGAFLNSDDTGLTTNVFLTEPRLFGVRVTKQWTGDPIWAGWGGERRARRPGERYPLEVQLGASVNRVSADTQAFAPSFAGDFAPGILPLETQDEDIDWGDGRDVRLVYAPLGGEWLFSMAGRFGRTNGESRVNRLDDNAGGYMMPEDQPDFLLPAYYIEHPGNYGSSTVRDTEDHAVVDFMVGKDVGLGAFGPGSRSSVSLGLRYAQFKSASTVSLNGMPDLYLPPFDVAKYEAEFHRVRADFQADRKFEGAGPALSWEASRPLLSGDWGEVSLDWAVNGAVLFGKQTVDIALEEQSALFTNKYLLPEPAEDVTVTPGGYRRVEDVIVPTVGGSLGLSYSLDRVKVSAGYRADRFFDAVDGGVAQSQKFDRRIDGPFLRFSLGFGG